MASKSGFTVFEQTMRIPVRTIDGSHRGMIFEAFFAKEFMPKQKFVQQHSGDWAMMGKCPSRG
jgi:hypothetical protein